MNAGIKFYPAKMIMRSRNDGTLRYTDLWSFRSSKSHKRYIVEVEHFDSHFFGVKFYWKGVMLSEHRYSYLTNDFEPRTTVMSCIMVMLNYFEHDRCASFVFIGANDMGVAKTNVPSRRFRFYRRLMLNIFSPTNFIQASDPNNSIYLLVNRAQIQSDVLTLPLIESAISQMYQGEFNLDFS